MTRAAPLPPRIERRAALLALVLLPACAETAGPDEPGPPPASSILVTTKTTGESIDADGYTVRLGARTVEIAVNGSARFDSVAPGTHQVELSDVAGNCTVTNGASVSVEVTGSAAGAVTFEVECLVDLAGIALPEIACPNLAPLSGNAMPLDEVGLGTAPAVLQRPLLARARWDGEPDATLGYIDESSGTARLVVPAHPSGSLDGGTVEIRVSDDDRTCPPFTFHIDALPAAPGEFAATIDLFQTLVAMQAEAAGMTVAGLMASTADDVHPALIPLLVAQALIEHELNENSLRAMLSGTAPDVDAVNVDVVNRIIARIGLRAELEDALSSVPGAAGTGFSARALSVPLVNAIECLSGIRDATWLDDCMTLGRGKVQGPIGEKVYGKATLATAAAASLPGAWGSVGSALDTMMLLAKHYAEALAGVLPTEFVSIDVASVPESFFEDQPGPGSWAPALVTATSTGWNLSPLMYDVLMKAIAGNQALQQFIHSKALKMATVRGGGQDAADFFESGTKFFASLLGKLNVLLPGTEYLEFDPEIFGPIDVSDPEFTNARIVSGDAVALTSHVEYQPREPGISLLEVITAPGKFGGTHIVTDPFVPIEVTAIEMAWHAFLFGEVKRIVLTEESEEQVVHLTVRNAMFPDQVVLDPLPPGKGSITEFTDLGDGVHRVTYLPPADLSALPALLVGRSTADTGARAFSETPLVAILEFVKAQVIVSPQSGCIEPGTSQQFAAEVTGFDNNSVTWSASADSISNDGVYTAPADMAPGTQVTITAVSVEAPTIYGEAILQVGGCICSYNAALSGGTSAVSQGPAQFRFSDDGSLTIRLEGTGPGVIGDRIHVGVTTAPAWSGETGQNPIVRATWFQVGTPLGGEFWPEVGLTCATCGGSVTVETVDDEFLTGSITATLPTGLPAEQLVPTTVVATFRAAIHYPGTAFSPYVECSDAWSDS